jgi:hypothetical protein
MPYTSTYLVQTMSHHYVNQFSNYRSEQDKIENNILCDVHNYVLSVSLLKAYKRTSIINNYDQRK